MTRILIFLSCFITFNSSAQKRLEFDTAFVSNKFSRFFSKNPSITKIQFSYNHQDHRNVLVYTNNDSLKKHFSYYDFNFIGDKFLFEKNYGDLSFPDDEIQSVLRNKCHDLFYLDLIAISDSIKFHMGYYCPEKLKKEDDEQIIFKKIEIHGGYKGGATQLEKGIQSALKQYHYSNKYDLKDSVLIYEVIIDSKDSCLKEVNLFYGEDSDFNQFILKELKNACQWWPAIMGGRAVKVWRRIFVKLNSDNTLTIRYPED